MRSQPDEKIVKQQGSRGVPRRSVLGGIAGLAAVTASVRAVAAETGERPNILWLVSEDNNPYVGAYGDPLARTPTIDGLARKGLLYRNAYSNAPVCAPSRFAILTGVYPESCAPANQMRSVAELPDEFRTYPELMRSAGYFCTNNAKTDYNCDVDPDAIWDEHGDEAHWRQRPQGKPFMSVFNYMTTHESRVFKPEPGRVTPDMVRLPASLPDKPGIRQDYATYYNLMEAMDAQLAERLTELEADGLADSTIVFHYSDNGGVLPRSKRYCYDEGLRCAMVVYMPPKWQHLLPARPGTEITSPVSFIDLAPTVLSLAGVRQPPQMRGKPLFGSRATAPQRYAFAMRNRMDERIDFQRTVTDGRWRYIRNYMPHRPLGQHQAFAWQAAGYQEWEAAHLARTLTPVQDRFFQPKSYEELYDLERDPGQVNNLARQHDCAPVLRTLSLALDEHMVDIHDNGFLPEGMAGEGWVASRDPAIYPLKEVMALGDLAASGEAGSLPTLLHYLGSSIPVLRYWAAMGLLILGEDALPVREALAQTLREDSSDQVRIVAAEALAGLGHEGEAVAALIAFVDNPPSWQVQLYALNALTFLGDRAQPALATLKRVQDNTENQYIRSASRYLFLKLSNQYTPESPIFTWTRGTEA